MVTIVSSTLRQNIYETIYDTLTAANLLSSTVTVTASYIDSSTSFPQVVISPVSVDSPRVSFGLNNVQDREITVLVDIYTRKNKEQDQIADEIESHIRGLSMNSVQLVGYSESVAVDLANDNKIHNRTISLGYRMVN